MVFLFIAILFVSSAFKRLLEVAHSTIVQVKKSKIVINNKILIEILKEDEVAQKLINNMIFMLEGLEKDYPKNIKILRR